MYYIKYMYHYTKIKCHDIVSQTMATVATLQNIYEENPVPK